LVTALLEIALLEKALRADMDPAVVVDIAVDPAVAEESLKGTDAKVVMVAANMAADTAAVEENLNDTAVRAATAAANMVAGQVAAEESRKDMVAKAAMAVVDLLPAADGNPDAKTTGVKAGRTSETTTAVRADMAAIVVSPAENAATVKARVDTARDREVTRNVITIRPAIDPANHTANRDVVMITTAAMTAERNVVGGIGRQTR